MPGQRLPGKTEADAADIAGQAGGIANGLVQGQAPQVHMREGIRKKQLAAIRAEGQRVCIIRPARYALLEAPGGYGIDLDSAIQFPDCQPPSIRAEGQLSGRRSGFPEGDFGNRTAVQQRDTGGMGDCDHPAIRPSGSPVDRSFPPAGKLFH